MKIEDIGPTTPTVTAPVPIAVLPQKTAVSRDATSLGRVYRFADGRLAKKQSFTLPVEVLERAKQAQKISEGRPGIRGHESLVALICAAIEDEITRIETEFDVQIEPLTGLYRHGRPLDSTNHPQETAS